MLSSSLPPSSPTLGFPAHFPTCQPCCVPPGAPSCSTCPPSPTVLCLKYKLRNKKPSAMGGSGFCREKKAEGVQKWQTPSPPFVHPPPSCLARAGFVPRGAVSQGTAARGGLVPGAASKPCCKEQPCSAPNEQQCSPSLHWEAGVPVPRNPCTAPACPHLVDVSPIVHLSHSCAPDAASPFLFPALGSLLPLCTPCVFCMPAHRSQNLLGVPVAALMGRAGGAAGLCSPSPVLCWDLQGMYRPLQDFRGKLKIQSLPNPAA